ncbi:4-hydroxy-3-methylbut-2-enyl diphosphate reductase [Marivirga atlantica]|jgi:4-hydroxy-3-methylbut-2-enyl diphosphate reductase|uniref:4-hydroxy-3-methylbut-2-enyl diphosphate reductase n=1 Tax=Marivirga atlantica TaxID=1548457 RepID=A0A937DI75_9BACT|nr:4-hydroxy-3-methylbut-2-enyl diphosphate reductase [Marivirga atlantica]MBL0766698.1 4-hydroxy-3-methylbut-2-enyl diphosphate reductase [Marivirga atlantica]
MSDLKVTIDQGSGYCFGVEYAIKMAEDAMEENGKLYCLGDIVHNDLEVKRLNAKGLQVINYDDLKDLRDCQVLIRAHGEPPETYRIALENNIELIDASCPVVLKLQNRVKNAHDKMCADAGQTVIYGKKGHAEVTGLTGQTNGKAIIIMHDEDLDLIDYTRPVTLFSQTTKSTSGFYRIKGLIEERMQLENPNTPLNELVNSNDSICRQVSNREPRLVEFSKEHDLILFVSGKKSSNGKALYQVCKANNKNSYFIEDINEIDLNWLDEVKTVGICGATSTPMWLMEKVKTYLENTKQPEPMGC